MPEISLERARPTTRTRRRRAALFASGVASLALPLLAVGVPEASADTPIGTTSVSGWKLSLDDNFNSINTATWTVKDGATNSNERSYLTNDNVTTSAGLLRIQGKKQSMGGRSYTSGYLDTRRKYALPNYFRVEIRAKVPLEMGMWAAPMWFRPSDGSGGEIDLLETYGADLQKFGNYHYHHTVHNSYGSGHQTNQKQGTLSSPLSWHTYTIEKTSGRIVMFVDGKQTGLWQQGDPSWFNQMFEAGKKWNMITNLQIGGARGNPNSSTDWSGDKTTLQVDYVRTWTK